MLTVQPEHKFADYPGVLPYKRSKEMFSRELDSEERCVRGTIVKGLTDKDMMLLDVFEGIVSISQPATIAALMDELRNTGAKR